MNNYYSECSDASSSSSNFERSSEILKATTQIQAANIVRPPTQNIHHMSHMPPIDIHAAQRIHAFYGNYDPFTNRMPYWSMHNK